jgi:hypothetical protein
MQDIDWAISAKVDFIAVSFVRTADVITNLRSYIQTRIAAQEQHEGAGVWGGGAWVCEVFWLLDVCDALACQPCACSWS